MTLDDQGREGVFAFLQAQGYTGTLDEWWAQVRAQSYFSEVRMFDTIWLNAPPVSEFPRAQAFIRRLLKAATPHFDVARHWDSISRLSISLSRNSARQPERAQSGLRLTGLSIDIEARGERLEIRCLTYVDGEFRRDRYFTFEKTSQNEGSVL